MKAQQSTGVKTEKNTKPSSVPPVPVVLFVYARPEHARRTLTCLRENRIPLLYVFSDGPRDAAAKAKVNEVRTLVRGIDWCEVAITERVENLGLGRSILIGVGEVLRKHEAVIVYEDDLVCVPGTYRYMCAAMERYREDSKVMSVTAWTHPRVTPADVGEMPYFDGRAECWVWGTWARAWAGMDIDSRQLLVRCKQKRIDIYKYGADLVALAGLEKSRNLWAVRFLYQHIIKGGLCVRPPWSMVEHIGFDDSATNSPDESWANPPLRSVPPTPAVWPRPVEHPDVKGIWQRECGSRPTIWFLAEERVRSIMRMIREMLRKYGRGG